MWVGNGGSKTHRCSSLQMVKAGRPDSVPPDDLEQVPPCSVFSEENSDNEHSFVCCTEDSLRVTESVPGTFTPMRAWKTLDMSYIFLCFELLSVF